MNARVTYSLLLVLLSPLLLLYLWLRGRKEPAYRQRWAERFALKPLQATDIWLHAVSMGESQAAAPIIKQLLTEHQQRTITITTGSPTGSAQVQQLFAKAIEEGRIQHCYLPFDLAICARRFIKQVQPKQVLIMETELWPNCIHYAAKAQAKIMLVNGRLSEKSLRQYQKYPRLIQPMLQHFTQLAVQTEVEALRFIALGVTPDKLHVCGNLKFDLQLPIDLKAQGQAMRAAWQRQHSLIWVAASVHPQEFAMVIEAQQKLLKTQPNALLIMVPRHPAQFDVAAQALEQAELKTMRRSQQSNLEQLISADTQVLLGDSMGEMLRWFSRADMALIGGSLFVHGGHNPLEAAALGLPTMMGPHYRDFLEVNQALQQAGNLTQVTDSESIVICLQRLLNEPQWQQKASAGGLAVVAANQGALAKQWQLVQQLF